MLLFTGKKIPHVICSPFTWPHFYLPPHYCTSRLLFLCLCYPSPLSSPTLASSCLYLCSGLKQRSLNHIRDGSFATCHPLYRSAAAVLSLFSCFFHISAFVSINPRLSSPLFLTLTQFSYTTLIISPLHLLSPLQLHHHPCLLSLIYQLSIPASSFLCPVNFLPYVSSLLPPLLTKAQLVFFLLPRLLPCASKSGGGQHTAPLRFSFIPPRG